MDMNENRTIYFAGGCFWGVEEYFRRIPGVVRTEVGYANGDTQNPTYEDVCYNHTGFAEAVKVEYDPARLELKTLIRQLFKIIDPLSKNKQGNDVGTQYRTGIYYVTEADKKAAEEVMAQEQQKYKREIATELLPLQNYYTAEEYHQKYLVKNPGGYCHISFAGLQEFE